MIKLLDILEEGALLLTPDERDQIEKIIPKVIDIIKGPQIKKSEYKKVDWIPYQFADKTPGWVFVYVGNDDPNAGGYFYTNNPNNPDDNIIVIQQSAFTKFFGIGTKTRKFLTGDEDRGIEHLRQTLKHELIHAKDPAQNHHFLKEPYDSKKEEVYYKSWAEFQTMTGQFFESIIAGVDRLLAEDPSEENIKKVKLALIDILNFFSGKRKSMYQDTVDFIQNTKSRNYFQNLLKSAERSLISLGILKYPGDPLSVYVYFINKIKQYHPDSYNEFLKDLYKVVDQSRDKINDMLRNSGVKRLQQLANIKEEESNDIVNDLKSQMDSLINGIEDKLEDTVKQQKEGILTVASLTLALPAILGLISRFGKAASSIIRKKFGSKPNQQSDTEEYFNQMGRIADELHKLYMKPLELVIGKFVKDPVKAKKIAHFIFHVIIGIMLLAAGVTAVKAIQSQNLSLATLETALSAIKGGEIKSYITKLLS